MIFTSLRLSKALFLSSPHAPKAWGTQSVQKLRCISKVATLKSYTCGTCPQPETDCVCVADLGNFDIKPEKFTLKINCFGWSMVHVPMPSHILCQKTRFFKNMSRITWGWILPTASWCHDWMFVSSKVFSGFPTVFCFFLDIFCGGSPKSHWRKWLNWTNFACPDWHGGKCENPRLGRIVFLNMY